MKRRILTISHVLIPMFVLALLTAAGCYSGHGDYHHDDHHDDHHDVDIHVDPDHGH
jgi:hypothetical protein